MALAEALICDPVYRAFPRQAARVDSDFGSLNRSDGSQVHPPLESLDRGGDKGSAGDGGA